MQRSSVFRLLADESGGGTAMGLFWFILLVGICGMAVDMTDGLRHRTMLQATADASALAGVIDLPDTVAAVSTAVAYSAANMGTDVNGAVLRPEDVVPGVWDHATRTFTEASSVPLGTELDAVYVMVNRSSDNNNPLPVNFLRIIGLQTWNIRAQAIAQRFVPECLRDGLVARNMVDISSNNGFVGSICVHGQRGVNLQSNNYFEEGVNVSMYDLDTLEIPASGMDSNIGLPEALRESSLDPRMVNHIDEIMLSYLDTTSDVIPDYIDLTDVDGDPLPVIAVDEKFDLSTVEEGRIYHVQCAPNKNARIPSNATIQDVVIIAECELHIGAGATVMNAVLGSRSGGDGNVDKANVLAAAGVQLGAPDNCASGGGVKIYSNATIHTLVEHDHRWRAAGLEGRYRARCGRHGDQRHLRSVGSGYHADLEQHVRALLGGRGAPADSAVLSAGSLRAPGSRVGPGLPPEVRFRLISEKYRGLAYLIHAQVEHPIDQEEFLP